MHGIFMRYKRNSNKKKQKTFVSCLPVAVTSKVVTLTMMSLSKPPEVTSSRVTQILEVFNESNSPSTSERSNVWFIPTVAS